MFRQPMGSESDTLRQFTDFSSTLISNHFQLTDRFEIQKKKKPQTKDIYIYSSSDIDFKLKIRC